MWSDAEPFARVTIVKSMYADDSGRSSSFFIFHEWRGRNWRTIMMIGQPAAAAWTISNWKLSAAPMVNFTCLFSVSRRKLYRRINNHQYFASEFFFFRFDVREGWIFHGSPVRRHTKRTQYAACCCCRHSICRYPHLARRTPYVFHVFWVARLLFLNYPALRATCHRRHCRRAIKHNRFLSNNDFVLWEMRKRRHWRCARNVVAVNVCFFCFVFLFYFSLFSLPFRFVDCYR